MQLLDTIIPLSALAGALAYGTGDFLGGRAAMRLPTFTVAAIAQGISVVLMAIYLSSTGTNLATALLSSAGYWAGMTYAIAVILLYHGIGHGRICIVAPLCGLASIFVPLAGDFHLDRPIGEWTLIGIALCGLAIILIAGSRPAGNVEYPTRAFSAVLGIGSGLAFGSTDLILGLSVGGTADSTAIVFTTRVTAAVATIIVLSAVRVFTTPKLLAKPTLPIGGLAIAIGFSAVAGILDIIGQLSYVAAASRGSMGVAATLTALFPGVTVLLALLFLREPVTRRQNIGFATALLGVSLVGA